MIEMPMMSPNGKPKKSELPATLKRSGAKAQRTFAEAHDSAVAQYGDGKRAHRVAYAALKHAYEKVDDRWAPKSNKGPSEAQAAGRVQTNRPTHGGVDVNATKDHLYQRAKQLDISGRSSMTKHQLIAALEKEARK